MSNPDSRQVYPTDCQGNTSHEIDGSACWCDPRVVSLCPQCDDPAHPSPGCWRCGGEGLVDITPELDDGIPTITIHNATVHP